MRRDLKHIVPIWKQYLSYIRDVHIESTQDENLDDLHVLFSKGDIQLCTDNAIYSYGYKYNNFKEAFEQTDIQKRDIKDVLVLGLGLGSVPLILERKIKKPLYFTCVEKDYNIISLATEYTMNYLKSGFEIIPCDAIQFINQTSDKYDLVISDIFVDTVIPDAFLKRAYLENLKNLLNPNGLLYLNMLAGLRSDRKSSKLFFEESFLPVFPNGKMLSVWKNYMLVSLGDY